MACYVETFEPRQDVIHLVTMPWAQASFGQFVDDMIETKSNHSTVCSWYKYQRLEPWPMIIKQCLEGLNYLHDRSPPLRHKDLNPDNILFLDETRDRSHPRVRPIIADFGHSKDHKPGALTSNRGTAFYQASEQFREPNGKFEGTTKSDIFSLGCCFKYIEGILHSGSNDCPKSMRLHLLVQVDLRTIFTSYMTAWAT
jgi:serine/threonine protein kinase